jgi:adhesin/invasin
MTAAVMAGATVPAFAAAGTRSLLDITRLPATGTASAYTAQTPNRILDTRATPPSLTGQTLNLTVAGGSTTVPAAATAVVLNVTVTNTTGAGFLTIWPAGSARPTISNLNWAAGETRPNLVTVTVGTGGQVSLFANSNTDVVVDEEGYYAAPAGTAGGYVAVSPARITDTRAGSGQANAGSTLGAGSTLSVQVTGAGTIPATGVSGVVLNATVTNTTASSFLTAWGNGTMPTVSNLNWVPGWTVPNRVIVPVSSTGKVNFYNKFGSTDLIVDVDGYYTDATAAGKLFTPMTPNRVIDTRLQGGTIGQAQSSTYAVGGFAGVPSGATGVIFNVTVTNTTASSYLTVYPNARPLASDLNWVAGQTIPNMTQATLSSTGTVSFYNNTGSTDLVVDLSGFFGQAAGVSVSANPSSIPADNKSKSTVTATVTKSDGTAAVNDPVSFTTSGGSSCGTLTGSTSPTDGNGKASVTYTANGTAGTCTVTATEAQGGLSGSTTITQTAVPNTVAGPATAAKVPADGTSTTPVTFTVKNGVTNAPVPGDTVTFATAGGATCGTLSGSTSPTDGLGQVTVTYKSTTTVGFCTVTATDTTAPGGSGSTTVIQTANPAPASYTGTVLANPTHAPADGTSTSTVTANFKQFGGASAINDPVLFTAGSGCGTFNPAQINTDGSGNAVSTYTTSITAGSCTLTATEAQSGFAATVAFVQDPVPNKIAVTASPSAIPADGASTSTVTATVTNGRTGAAVSAEAVTFTSSGTCGTPGTSGPTNTNSSGQASYTYTSSTTTGFCTITAKDAGAVPPGGATATTTITQTSAAPGSITVTASKSSVPADNKSTSTITATVKNASGTPIGNDPVNFTTNGATACGTLTGSTSPTNPSGQASVTYTANATVGSCTITAAESKGGLSNSTSITQTAVANKVTGPAASPKVPADGISPATIQFTVTSGVAPNGPIQGDTVTFATSGGTSCGTLSGSTSPTDVLGHVSVTYKASTAVGFCTVTATDTTAPGGAGSTQVIQTSNPAPTTYTGSVLGNPTHAPADGTSTSVVTANFKQSGGASAVNDPVFFTASSGCGSFNPPQINTDGSGNAVTTYTTSTTAGTCTITATEAQSGFAATVAFVQDIVPNKISVTAVPSIIKADGVSQSVVTATVTDQTGAPVTGEPVAFTNSGGASCGTPATSGPTNTNASGQVSFTYTSSTTIGFCTITAKDAGAVPPAGAGGASATTTITQTA